jgi:tetratricopeptide (TPR) repeat protein
MISTLIDLLGRFYANKDFISFAAIARSMHATIPDDQVSLQFLGLAYYRSGRVHDALQVFNQLVRRRKPAVDVATADSRRAHGESHSAAAACYREATRRNPEIARAWYDLGVVLLKLRKYRQAIPAFRSALVAQPEFPQAAREIGKAARQLKERTTAAGKSSRRQAHWPGKRNAGGTRGNIAHRRGDYLVAPTGFVKASTKHAAFAGIAPLARHAQRRAAGMSGGAARVARRMVGAARRR